MNKKAQAGLEYLMTYGWALILVVTVIGVLVFIVSTPTQDIMFRSSDPTKLLLKSAASLADAVQVKLQNITGGKITVTALTSDDYASLTINGEIPSELNPVEVGTGGELFLEGTGSTGTITITYLDYAGIRRTVTVTGGDGTGTVAAFNPGSGTLGDPFNIRDCDALQRISDGNLDTHNQLTRSFSCSEIANFDPIGDGAIQFTGSFDGQGFTISGLTINRPSEWFVGLFGYAGSGVSINNIGLTGVNITGGSRYTGALVGWNPGSVTNSYSTGSVTGNSEVGGLVGSNLGSVTDSYSAVIVDGHNNVGGLVGQNLGSVTDSYSTGSANGNINIGGLIGYNINPGSVTDSYSTASATGAAILNTYVGGLAGNNTGSITNSYSTGNANGDGGIGGLVGLNQSSIANSYYSTGSVTGTGYWAGGLVGLNYGTILNSYSTGSVTGNESVGGLVGHTSDFVTSSYSTGSVTGNSEVGGLVGSTTGTPIVNGYWFNSQSTCYFGGNSGCPTAASEDAVSDFFGSSHAVYNHAGTEWDFATIWNDTGSYPTLR